MAALALMTAACSNSDNDILTPAEQPAKAQGIPFTATISIGESASTRALVEDGSGGLTATWAENDEVALIHNGIIDKVTVASVSGGVATITGSITGSPTTGDAVTVIYPYDAADGTTGNVKAHLLEAQDGTLATIAAKYDARKGTGTLKVGGTASLNGNVSLTNQFAIWKLTLDKTAKDLYITAGGEFLAGATLTSAGTEFTVAVPSVSSKTVAVVATDGSSNCWIYSKASVSLATGNYYQSNVAMTAVGTESSEAVYKITGTVSTQTIPDGKTVVLSGVTISGSEIVCSGNANIILLGDDNTVIATTAGQAAIQIGGSGTTLTISGTGSLTAKGGNGAAGIGTNGDNNSSSDVTGGNIVINGGTVTATGGSAYAAGIGTGVAFNKYNNSCGDITINGGTVTATSGQNAAGIGTGLANKTFSNTCGDITIGTGVTSVTAIKGYNSPNSIGKGTARGTQTCGKITFGTAQVFDGSAWSTDPMTAGTYGGLTLAISTTTRDNDTWMLTPAP